MVDLINQSGFLKYDLVQTLINIVFIIGIAFIASKLLKKYILKFNRKNQKYILRMKNIAIYAFALYGIFNQFTAFSDIIKALAASTGVITLALGLAAQDAVGNFVNGLMIATFHPFKIGDLIKLTDYNLTGYVLDISLRHTVIKTFENTEIIIPNSIMNKAILENVSSVNNRKANFLEMDISYESDIDLAVKIIEEEVMAHPKFTDIRSEEEINNGVPAVTTRLVAFLDSSMHLKTTIYSKDNAEGFAMLSDLRISIKRRFDKEGIEIPYPHQTVEIKQ